MVQCLLKNEQLFIWAALCITFFLSFCCKSISRFWGGQVYCCTQPFTVGDATAVWMSCIYFKGWGRMCQLSSCFFHFQTFFFLHSLCWIIFIWVALFHVSFSLNCVDIRILAGDWFPSDLPQVEVFCRRTSLGKRTSGIWSENGSIKYCGCIVIRLMYFSMYICFYMLLHFCTCAHTLCSFRFLVWLLWHIAVYTYTYVFFFFIFHMPHVPGLLCLAFFPCYSHK